MLNWLLLYSVVMSFTLRFHYHNKVVVPGNEEGALKWTAAAYARGLGLTVIFWTEFHSGILGEGYEAWWTTHFSEHSMMLWFAVVVPTTLGLYLVKEVTFAVMKRPGSYGWFVNKSPCLHRLNMRMPLVWNLVFWGWVLFCPWLPFARCFLRIFLFRTPAVVGYDTHV